MSENKREICDLLCKVLQATRDGSDLQEIRYEKTISGLETATLVWPHGTMKVNVSMDSGVAMIRDITRNL